ncbi:Pre-mRNA-splicing factor of RES complex-domain-containing protein [Amylocarpus encephaloides]|uniref:Pre-mRNA-splicing factor of RES complex-domain-containing protein n=1 Tax=Amylocarpus encephaloides TaxID=45428 RepID=A0A9P7Y8H0_9HELO|nr:Pre-mRNA-splicing factor of RES complex-domain-containing protein [Amylocarpus encephaloides]
MSLSSYLASKYLNAEPSPTPATKKRKRKNGTSASAGLIIADDDALGWNSSTVNPDDDGSSRPLAISSGSSEFRKAKKNAWKTVGVPALQPNDADTQAADRIIEEAARENAAAIQADEAPVVDDDAVVKMDDGTHAGLQSAAAVAEQFEKRKREEREAWEAESRGKKGKGKDKAAEDTVYRDATGRRIDISMRRQEARREQDEQARKEREEKEAQKGDVQRAMKGKRKEELEEARFMGLARGVDDAEMNDDLKAVERWNDPAAQFLSKKEGKSATGRPMYKGASQPNRYGISPGHKWDGVDRSNGWEGERFKAMNRRTRNKELDFAWQMDE